jgi:oligopeptide transport system permease protein
MLRFVLSKFLWMLTVLISVTLLTFLLMHAIPGNPWSNYSSSPRMGINTPVDQSVQRELNRHYGLDLPLWRQFIRYLIGDFQEDGSFICGAICGNLGPSTRQRGRSVQEVLFAPPEGKTFWESRFGYSIRLAMLGFLIAVGVGIPLGILSAAKPKSALSRSISIGLAALISIPNFVLGLLAIIVLASWLKVIKVLPDWENPRDWILPAIVLAAVPMASLARVTRSSITNTMHDEYVRTARAKGLTQSRTMLIHVMRNALILIVIFLGPTLMEMFAGAFIVESLFSFPGFGREFWSAVVGMDYSMVLGLTLLYAIGIVLVNITIETLHEFMDPRVRSIREESRK